MDETNAPNIELQSTIMNCIESDVENFLVKELTKEEIIVENEDKPLKIRKYLQRKSKKRLLISFALLFVGLLVVAGYLINKIGGTYIVNALVVTLGSTHCTGTS